jgi:predicted phage tail protein
VTASAAVATGAVSPTLAAAATATGARASAVAAVTASMRAAGTATVIARRPKPHVIRKAFHSRTLTHEARGPHQVVDPWQHTAS